MAQRTDIVSISFQANARGANAAIESLRVECERCNDKVRQLKDQLKAAVSANMPADQIDALRKQLNGATKEAKQFDTAYKELVKGMRTLDQGIKAFNDGSLSQMNQAFQKALYNAAKLTRTKLNPLSETYKRDKQELTALMDASQQYYARQQADSAMVIKTIKEGGKVSRQAINDELTAHRELLQVLAEDDAGYQRTVRNIAVLEQHLRAMGGNYGEIRKNITDTQKVSDEMLRNMYNELQKTNQEGKVTKDIMRENAKAMREIRAEQARRVESTLGGDLTKQDEGAIRQAIASAKELLSTYKTGSKQAQTLSAQIVNAEEHLKTHGVEGERAARKQAEAAQLLADKYKMMQDRVKNLGKLSDGALAETQKFWQAQMDGAERGSKAYREAEKNMKAVAAEQERLAKAQMQRQANRIAPDKLGRSRLGSLSEQELQASIAAAKQLAASMKPTDAAYKDLVNNIIRAEEHVKQFGLEGQRSARQAADQMQMMVDRMSKLKSLSGGALEETKKFWDTQMAGAERGSKAYLEAESHIKNIVAEQERLAAEQAKTAAQGIYGNKMTMSEASIRKAIEAAKQYQQTLSATDAEYKRLSAAIVDAEEHIKKYGIESERAARKELEAAMKAAEERKKTDDLMKQQLQQGTALSRSALKAQEQYWQRLIDDPKTAAASLAEYEARLREVQGIIRTQKREQGRQVLSEFRRDPNLGDTLSADKLKEYTDNLKAYRDTLPKSANAATIKEIDDIMQKVGASAKKAAEQTMPLRDAYRVAMQGLQGSFQGTNEQLKQAKKTLEEQFAAAEKGTRRYNLLQRALNGIELEEKRVADISKEIQAVLDQPKGRSFNELKQAVEQGRAALQNMRRTTTQEKKDFDELAAKIKAADQEMKNLGASAKGTASAFDKAWSRLKTYIGLYVGAAVAMQKLTSTMGDLMDLSDKMGEVRKTTGFTADEVGRLSGELKKLDTRTTLNGLLDLSVAAGQLGLKTEEDVLGFTEAANKLMVALPEMGREGATEMLKVALATGEIDKIRKQMEQGLIDGSSATAVAMEKVGSTIDRLRATSAATAPAITDFVKRVGAVGAQSGITIDQVAALGSTVDALGMRVEMSATALSRMIPAIKNNAFALAQAIGVTPETIRNLFDTGRGMEVILMVLQRIKDSGMDADSIENMLGMAGMKDIMKDLNQQGARAGIVFAGLSQNVDTLRKHLATASEAYEENIAIQQEYDKMNETTAAKWERLKNQLEETFVGDGAQRFLGGIIDGLRWIVDMLTGSNGVSVALRSVLLYLGLVKLQLISIAKGALKSIWEGLKNIAVMLGVVKGEMTKLQWANIFTAAAGAVLYFVMSLKDAAAAVSSVSKAIGQLEEDLRKERKTLEELFLSANKTNVELEKSRSRLEEVKKAGGDSADAENKLKKANADHAATIREINSKYGAYLGYMLSETSSAGQLAKARDLINSKLRETITLKQREAALGNVEQEYGGRVNKRAASVENTLQTFFGKDYNATARVSVAISEAAQKYANDSKRYRKAVQKILSDNKIQKDVSDEYMGTFDRYRSAINEYRNQENVVNRRFEAQVNVTRKKSREKAVASLNAIQKDWQELVTKYRQAEGEEKKKLAAEVYRQQRNYANSLANNAGYFDNDRRKEIFDKNVKNMATYEKGLRSVAGEAIRTIDAMERAETKVTGTDFTNGGESANNPWGAALRGESTDWKNMTAEQLVNRRKQMKDFVNAIQTDTDVQSVLKEDAALKKAIEAGMSSDMRTVIEWYNTERLKIQDELHARHLTNTGDWMDPKKEKGARKQFRDELDAYLHELDAYYTERKTRIEEAGTDEGLTEAEISNRTLNNEMEWQQRRAELQKLYSRKQKEVTEEEMDAIYHIIAERTGDSESFVKAQIARTNQFVDVIEKSGKRGAAIVHRWMSQVELDTERSYLKGQQALTKQMRAVEAIIDKERPFNGITKSLQESLSTMDILTGEMRKEYSELMKQGGDMTGFNNRQAQEELKRTAFLLGEAENAYSTTADRVMDDMRQKGMAAWADWLSADPKLQEAMMAQLRSTYDAIQDAIKKEASQLKKQAEIMWNNILMPDGKTTLKQTTDRVIAQLTLDEGRVKRANSLTGAGQASERVADRLAIQQMKVQLAMQEHYYNLMRKQGQAHVDMLKAQARAAKERGDEEEATRKTLDAQHAQMSLNLATAKEETELAKQREDITARTEESQNRLYTELKSWAGLISSSLQSLFEAGNAGNAEYYNERAMMDLTGSGGPGAGTYTVIEDAGTGDARAHYEYLDKRQALERQHEIEVQNAQADAWKKVMDDINMKLSETITDQLNAVLQAESIDANTQAVIANTQAIYESMGRGGSTDFSDAGRLKRDASGMAVDESGQVIAPIQPAEQEGEAPAWKPFWQMTEEDKAAHQENMAEMFGAYRDLSVETETEKAELLAEVPGYAPPITALTEEQIEATGEMQDLLAQKQIEADNKVAGAKIANQTRIQQAEQQAENQMAKGSRNMYAAMTSAANLYGAAYQAMTNDNLSAAQKFEMIALQAAGQSAMAMLQTKFIESEGGALVSLPELLAKCLNINPIAGAAIFAVLSALIGAGIGIAASNLSKSKSEIAKTTGASSASGGRLSTGMLTYAEGNVDEFTDPKTLTPGRSYNVDGADGRTYRAKYTGTRPQTHLTGGPEFHLAGERGREMIIDADTTRQITMNEAGIWHAIQTLSGGGRLRHAQRRGRGVHAFADGNMDEFEEIGSEMGAGDSGMGGAGSEQLAAFQSSLDRNNELLERALTEGIHARFDVYGKGGLIDSYDQGKKTVARHGERY